MIIDIQDNYIDTNKIFGITSITLCGESDVILENYGNILIQSYKFEILSEGNNKFEIFLSGFNELFKDDKNNVNEKSKEILGKLRKELIFYWNKNKQYNINEIVDLHFKL